jgi:C4-dicarboxylate-specific signal transduction histidine kinase
MAVQPESSTEEIKLLRRCINDLVSVLALPAMWTGGPPSQIAGNLLDALMSMLSLDFIYVRLRDSSQAGYTDMMRVDPTWIPKPTPQEIGGQLQPWLGVKPQELPQLAKFVLGGRDMVLVPLLMGLRGELGLLIAGSRRSHFPQQTERLLLSVAANQAAIGLQEANLLSALDQRVAERTAELAAANEELKREVADRKAKEKKLQLNEEARRLAQEALNKARSELAQVARATSLTALTAAIAHEVNQPLSGIVTNASTCVRMLDTNPPNLEGARETAKRTIRDGNRASEVITRLRALFSKKTVSYEPFDLNEAAKEVIALSLGDLQRNGVIVQTDLATELPSVLGDRIQVQQVILNLIRNGSDAMSAVTDRPRELTVKTDLHQSGGVCISVKDSGVGFDSQTEQKLFEPFYTTKADGMGIGLSVSRSIMESHRGRLWAIRNEGPGATFLFSVPCATNT